MKIKKSKLKSETYSIEDDTGRHAKILFCDGKFYVCNHTLEAKKDDWDFDDWKFINLVSSEILRLHEAYLSLAKKPKNLS